MSGTKKRKKQLVLTLSISRRIDCLLNANEELSYRVPKRVRKCILLNDSLYAVCPRCGVSIERDYVAYCSRCGQRLNWVGYELRAWRKSRQKRRWKRSTTFESRKSLRFRKWRALWLLVLNVSISGAVEQKRNKYSAIFRRRENGILRHNRMIIDITSQKTRLNAWKNRRFWGC